MTAKDTKILARMEAILAEHDPCQIRVSNGVATCRSGTPCCRGCRHLGGSGCAVVSPACKFYFCRTAWAVVPPLVKLEICALGQIFEEPLRMRFDGAPIDAHGPLIW